MRAVIVLKRELQVLYKSSFTPFLGATFLLILFLMMSFVDLEVSASVFARLLWIVIMLSLPMCAQGVFAEDMKEGIIPPMVMNGVSTSTFMFGKIIAMWVGVCGPMVLSSALLLLIFSSDWELALYFFFSMLLGAVSLSSFALLGSVMTLFLKNSAALLPLLVIPLYVPVLALGTMIIKALDLSLPVGVYIQFLLVMGVISILAVSFVGGLIIRESL